jgi:hypothetical protein
MGGEAPADKRQWGLDRPRLRVKRWRQSREDERRRHQRDNQPSNENRGGSKGDGDGDRECRAPPSRDLAATALVLAAEAAAALIADEAIGGNSGVTIIGSASLAAGGRVIN